MSSKKVALITGANKGLGHETSRRLAQQGIRGIIGARDESKGKAAAQTLKDEGLDAEAIQLDVTRSDHIQKVRKYIKDTYGRLDILVLGTLRGARYNDGQQQDCAR